MGELSVGVGDFILQGECRSRYPRWAARDRKASPAETSAGWRGKVALVPAGWDDGGLTSKDHLKVADQVGEF